MCRHESLSLCHLIISTLLGSRYCDYSLFRSEKIKVETNWENLWMVTQMISSGESGVAVTGYYIPQGGRVSSSPGVRVTWDT